MITIEHIPAEEDSIYMCKECGSTFYAKSRSAILAHDLDKTRKERDEALAREKVLENALERLRSECQYEAPPCEECRAFADCIEAQALLRVKAMREGKG